MIMHERLLKLPAMQEWVDAGLAEARRDPAHDDEVALAGEVISNLRAAPRG